MEDDEEAEEEEVVEIGFWPWLVGVGDDEGTWNNGDVSAGLTSKHHTHER